VENTAHGCKVCGGHFAISQPEHEREITQGHTAALCNVSLAAEKQLASIQFVNVASS